MATVSTRHDIGGKAKTIALDLVVNLCRLILGVTFVFSGFVKAVDPIGTQYKIQDYIAVLGVGRFVPDLVTLLASVALSALEFCLGVFILFAIRRRLVSNLVVAFMAIMTMVTIWIAVFNPVKDCGCFGDAIHLTNIQTLAKNFVLLTASIVVAWQPMRMYRFLSRSTQWIAVNYSILFVLLLCAHCLYHLPLIDFRPYHIGVNIKKGMEIPANAAQPQFKTTFVLQKNGVKKEFTLDNYPDSSWQFVDSKTIQTKEGYVPPIHDFSIQKSNGDDITDSVLTAKGYVFLLISPHIEQADDTNFGDIDQLYEYCQEQKIPFYCLTASTGKDIEHWADITGAEYPFCFTDETTLKTIIRSNPGLLLLKNSTIIRKWSHNDLPSSVSLNAPLSQLEIGSMPSKSLGQTILKVVLLFFIPLILLVLADRTWTWTRYIRGRRLRKRH